MDNATKSLFTERNSLYFVALFSAWIAFYYVVLLRIFDFLRYIDSIAESVVLPMLGLGIGLVWFRKWSLTLKWSIRCAILSMILLPLMIYLSQTFLVFVCCLSVFAFMGMSLRIVAQSSLPTSTYSFETFGWAIGTICALIFYPIVGADYAYVLLISILAILNLMAWPKWAFIELGTIVGVSFIAVWSSSVQKLTIMDILQELPSKHFYLNNTLYNGYDTIKKHNGKLLDSIWTYGDKIDIINQDGVNGLYYNNSGQMLIPKDVPEDQLSSTPIKDHALVLGVGGGIDFYNLEQAGYRNIDGLEILSHQYEFLRENYVPQLFGRNNVLIEDAFRFLKHNQKKYDIILHASPHSMSKIDSSGWPIENAIDSPQALAAAFDNLKANGLFILKVYYREDHSWMKETVFNMRETLVSRGLDPKMSMKLFREKKEFEIYGRTRIIIAIKNGIMTDQDNLRVTSIENIYIPMSENTELDNMLQKIITSPISEAMTMAQSQNQISRFIRVSTHMSSITSLLMFIAILVLLLYRTRRIEKRINLYTCFFSGAYFAALEIMCIKKLSFYFPTPFYSLILVISIFVVTIWVSNIFITPKAKKIKSLRWMSPILSAAFMLALIHWFPEGSVLFKLFAAVSCLFLIGALSSHNFNAALYTSEDFFELYLINLLGFVFSSACVFTIFYFGLTKYLPILICALSFYGLVFLRTKARL